MKNPRYKNNFEVTIHPDLIEKPLQWKSSKIIFVNSMSDLFHEEVDFEYIKSIFEIMSKANQHTFQILTKRAERLAELAPHLPWTDNIWQGVTVENDKYLHRIEKLKQVPAKIRFISFKPLIGPISYLSLDKIHWVIVGGESGPKARSMDPEWVRKIRSVCLAQKVPFFFKQWGGVQKKKNGRTLDNKTWDEYPLKV